MDSSRNCVSYKTSACGIYSDYWHCQLSMWSRVYVTVQCLVSVSLSVPPWTHSSKTTAAGLLLWVL